MGINKQMKERLDSREIKNKIMQMLKNLKEGNEYEDKDLSIIYYNLGNLDHHDAVRLDQILTIIANKKETEYQWASIVMEKKFKIL